MLAMEKQRGVDLAARSHTNSHEADGADGRSEDTLAEDPHGGARACILA